ncbi:MAG: hypothetical protein HKM07_01620, partial [Chlamydiae bacterium]|nr:hypothetical protein [Chlamydiota bacterium]
NNQLFCSSQTTRTQSHPISQAPLSSAQRRIEQLANCFKTEAPSLQERASTDSLGSVLHPNFTSGEVRAQLMQMLPDSIKPYVREVIGNVSDPRDARVHIVADIHTNPKRDNLFQGVYAAYGSSPRKCITLFEGTQSMKSTKRELLEGLGESALETIIEVSLRTKKVKAALKRKDVETARVLLFSENNLKTPVQALTKDTLKTIETKKEFRLYFKNMKIHLKEPDLTIFYEEYLDVLMEMITDDQVFHTAYENVVEEILCLTKEDDDESADEDSYWEAKLVFHHKVEAYGWDDKEGYEEILSVYRTQLNYLEKILHVFNNQLESVGKEKLSLEDLDDFDKLLSKYSMELFHPSKEISEKEYLQFLSLVIFHFLSILATDTREKSDFEALLREYQDTLEWPNSSAKALEKFLHSYDREDKQKVFDLLKQLTEVQNQLAKNLNTPQDIIISRDDLMKYSSLVQEIVTIMSSSYRDYELKKAFDFLIFSAIPLLIPFVKIVFSKPEYRTLLETTFRWPMEAYDLLQKFTSAEEVHKKWNTKRDQSLLQTIETIAKIRPEALILVLAGEDHVTPGKNETNHRTYQADPRGILSKLSLPTIIYKMDVAKEYRDDKANVKYLKELLGSSKL